MVIILKRRVEPRTPMLKWHLPMVVRVPVPRPKIDEQTVAEIVNDVADRHGVHPNALLSKNRDKRIVAARHQFIAEFMREYKLSLSHGAAYLKLDRDTIRNALKKNLKREVERDLQMNGYIE